MKLNEQTKAVRNEIKALQEKLNVLTTAIFATMESGTDTEGRLCESGTRAIALAALLNSASSNLSNCRADLTAIYRILETENQ